jgi:NitT/TauT family transport system substrate-binding protein
MIAQKKGFFEKYGVQVEAVYYDALSDTFPDLASGQIDGALIAVGDIININRSAEMKVVAISDDGGASAILAGPEITRIEDLKGKTIGVLIGSQYELMVSEMLRSANMDAGDVTVIAVDPRDAALVLMTNQVQAVYTWEPFLSQAISNGNKLIYPTESQRLFPNMVVFRKSIAEQRPDDVRAFLRAWFDAINYRLQNPELTRSLVADYLGVSIQEVQPDNNLKIFTLNDNKAFFNIQGENSIFAVTKNTSDFLISIGAIAQMVDPLELLDPTYMP